MLTESQRHQIARAMMEDYNLGRDIDKLDFHRRPQKSRIVELVHKLQQIVFPGLAREDARQMFSPHLLLSLLLEDVTHILFSQITVALQSGDTPRCHSPQEAEEQARSCTLAFFRQLPHIRALAQTDLDAAWEGDPAASSRDEILFSYPGLFAITVHRLAHALYLLEVPMIPRMMNEYAHSVTGIDIHPGATIGDHFFLDHGTGVVIGETTRIGSHVRIYQGVTLGALSTRGGQNLRGVQRHPTIEDGVTIYAGASILGGETVIGANTVVGSNVFLTRSTGPNMTVRTMEREPQLCRRRNCDDCQL